MQFRVINIIFLFIFINPKIFAAKLDIKNSLIYNDYKNFYSKNYLRTFSIVLMSAGTIANTPIDRGIRDF